MSRADVPKTRYAKSGDLNIAYQVFGDGPVDLVVVPGWVSHVEAIWDDPYAARMLRRLTSFARVILLDKRGTGASDRVRNDELPTIEERMDDVRAVMDAAGSERAVLFGISEGGAMSLVFAATYPERVTALIVYGAYARWIRDDDYPWAPTREQHESAYDLIEATWGDPTPDFGPFAPSMNGDTEYGEISGRFLRVASSPGGAVALNRMNIEIDARSVLPTIRVPTLVLHRKGDMLIQPGCGRYIADHVPHARYIELEGNDHVAWIGDSDALVDEVEEFITGERATVPIDRVLATVLFTDIVSSTPQLAAVGDRKWREQLDRHDAMVRMQLERYRGREVNTAGDSFFAVFDGPARAIRCAQAIVQGATALGVDVRAGVHTGECETRGDDYSGIAVHVGARVASLAEPGQVLATSTVRDLVAGSGIEFDDRGTHVLKGVPDEWRLFAAH